MHQISGRNVRRRVGRSGPRHQQVAGAGNADLAPGGASLQEGTAEHIDIGAGNTDGVQGIEIAVQADGAAGTTHDRDTGRMGGDGVAGHHRTADHAVQQELAGTPHADRAAGTGVDGGAGEPHRVAAGNPVGRNPRHIAGCIEPGTGCIHQPAVRVHALAAGIQEILAALVHLVKQRRGLHRDTAGIRGAALQGHAGITFHHAVHPQLAAGRDGNIATDGRGLHETLDIHILAAGEQDGAAIGTIHALHRHPAIAVHIETNAQGRSPIAPGKFHPAGGQYIGTPGDRGPGNAIGRFHAQVQQVAGGNPQQRVICRRRRHPVGDAGTRI